MRERLRAWAWCRLRGHLAEDQWRRHPDTHRWQRRDRCARCRATLSTWWNAEKGPTL